MKAASCNSIFEQAINDYHIKDRVDQEIDNPFPENEFSHLLYLKNWIDTVQWHYEDLIRDPDIIPEKGMQLKRLIDASNQHRTDVVEKIDDYYLKIFSDISIQPDAGLNTESPAWVLDRLSILCLKIYHMKEQIEREDIGEKQKKAHGTKLNILLEQQRDLSASFDQLINDLTNGIKVMKVYRQMKLYNDPETNPVLYGKKNTD